MHAADTTTPDAVLLDSAGVKYRVPIEVGVSLKEILVRRRRPRTVEFEALRDIDLHVRRGETIGIIGRNGAGKTTLLKLIARLLHPTTGRIRIRGRVAPMIDLFGALHHELTARENAYLSGALLGLSRKEMNERIGAIAEFADIGQFFDAPLRTCSVGMMVRVAFATATSVDPDILLIDEALGVGDAAFYKKSSAKIEEFRSRGVTSILVSHDLQRLAEMSDRMLWLENGRVAALGAGRDVVEQYLAALTAPSPNL